MFANLFGKKTKEHTIRIAPTGVEVLTTGKKTVLQSALNQGIAFPHNCRAGGCGECKCRLIKGKVKELTDKSYILSAEELRDNYILACQSIPQSDIDVAVELRSEMASAPVQRIAGHITRLLPLTHDIVQVTVGLDEPLRFTPGQYAEISALTDGAEGIIRSYSFASVPGADGTSTELQFFIRKVPGGRFTEWLFGKAKVGDRLQVNGPFGDFTLREAPAPILLIAGGSGLAPVLAILQGALQSLEPPRAVTLIFGARSQADLYMLDTIEALRREWPESFQFVPILAQEPAGSDWAGRRGWIPEYLSDMPGDWISTHHAYLCGPPGMIDNCVERLSAAGVMESAIYFDKFLDQSHLASVACTA
jgi:NAD(P)H-flavin reductase/ferredoxin